MIHLTQTFHWYEYYSLRIYCWWFYSETQSVFSFILVLSNINFSDAIVSINDGFHSVFTMSVFTEWKNSLWNVFTFLVLNFQNSEWSSGQLGAAGSVLQSNVVVIPGGHIAAHFTWTAAHLGGNRTLCHVSHSSRCWGKAILCSTSCEDRVMCAGVCSSWNISAGCSRKFHCKHLNH